VILTSSSADAPAVAAGSIEIAAIDVEWSKDYRVKDGNVPFCYSVIWLSVPAADLPANPETLRYAYAAAYVERQDETQDLISSADAAAGLVLRDAGIVAGHQLCSDLAVLLRAAHTDQPAVTRLREAWHRRAHLGQPRIIDTRYDIADLLTGSSRRLVDVSGELGLDVTQPELRSMSMTALHRRWLETGDVTAREKISVLNLRHSLSTALLAARAARIIKWDTTLNVNRMLAAGLSGTFGWTSAAEFAGLLGGSR
jgi:hypothetical protein